MNHFDFGCTRKCHDFFPGASVRSRVDILFLWLGVAIASYAFLSVYFDVLSLKVWRHDELLMMESYLGNLKAEGRWLNYLAFKLLRTINPQICIVICLACLFYFSYQVSERFCHHRLGSIFFALCCLQLPPFYSFIGWIQTFVPTFLVLAFLTYLSMFLRKEFIFFLGGVLFFGGLNNFYNLLPLLYLSDFQEKKISQCVYILLLWVLGFIFGYFTALSITWIIGGTWGIQIASWRNPHPVHSLSDLFVNTKSAFKNLYSHVRLTGKSPIHILFCFTVGFCVLHTAIDLLRKRREFLSNWLPFGAIICSGMACYIQSIPMGLSVGIRTALPFFAAIFCLSLLLFKDSKTISVILFLNIITSCFLLNSTSIQRHAVVTNTWRSHVPVIEADPVFTRKVHMCFSDADISKSEREIMRNQELMDKTSESFGQVMRFRSVLKSLGYHHYDQAQSQECTNLNLPHKTNQVFEWAIYDHELYLWFK
jgi:hypothetical protein